VEKCEWCESTEVEMSHGSVYWELPDGLRAIEIENTPTVICQNCQMIYQSEKTTKVIEDQLF
jgi:uncharacterized YokU family protein